LGFFGDKDSAAGLQIVRGSGNDILIDFASNTDVASLTTSVDRFFLSFYSTTTQTAKGFNITFCAGEYFKDSATTRKRITHYSLLP